MNERRARRRLKMASRQFTLAQIARREAMASLANAVAEESRSAQLTERSRELLKEYNARSAAKTAHDLQGNAQFVSRLHEVAEQAGKAWSDASDQTAWQMQTLAKADTRASRFDEQMDAARREVDAIQSRREAVQSGKMARKLHSNPKTAGES